MKKGLKIVFGVFIFIYLIVVVFTTGLLLSRDDKGVSKFLGKYYISLDDDSLEPDYKKNTLLIIKPVKDEDIEIGDKIFYYFDKKIKFLEVTNKEKTNEKYTSYTVKDNNQVSSDYVLGTEKTASTNSFFGKVLYILQSKWGFLLIVVFPLFLAFIYEIYAIVKEFKKK